MDVVGMGKKEVEDGGKKVVRDVQVIRVVVNNQPMKLESLEAKLFSLQRQIPDAEITLDVKPNVWYENVVQVFNICARNHFKKVAFAQPAPGQ
jgi:biopolymer transport protein ExbD